jgi:hypothetical protein
VSRSATKSLNRSTDKLSPAAVSDFSPTRKQTPRQTLERTPRAADRRVLRLVFFLASSPRVFFTAEPQRVARRMQRGETCRVREDFLSRRIDGAKDCEESDDDRLVRRDAGWHSLYPATRLCRDTGRSDKPILLRAFPPSRNTIVCEKAESSERNTIVIDLPKRSTTCAKVGSSHRNRRLGVRVSILHRFERLRGEHAMKTSFSVATRIASAPSAKSSASLR